MILSPDLRLIFAILEGRSINESVGGLDPRLQYYRITMGVIYGPTGPVSNPVNSKWQPIIDAYKDKLGTKLFQNHTFQLEFIKKVVGALTSAVEIDQGRSIIRAMPKDYISLKTFDNKSITYEFVIGVDPKEFKTPEVRIKNIFDRPNWGIKLLNIKLESLTPKPTIPQPKYELPTPPSPFARR